MLTFKLSIGGTGTTRIKSTLL